MPSTAAHWDTVYAARSPQEVSWFTPAYATSLRLVRLAAGTDASVVDVSVVDVGAGASTLVDALLEEGSGDVTVLDVSEQALAVVRERLAGRPGVALVAADLLAWEPGRTFDVWHDRAVFHFLTDPADRRAYVALATRAVRPGGAVVIGTFAADGPTSCSGLPTARYDPDELADLFSSAFAVEHAEREEHRTPAGALQPFTWLVLRRQDAVSP